MTPPTQQYAFTPTFILGALFIVLAPVFWLHVEAPANKTGLPAPEQADLHQRIYPSFHYGFSELRGGRLPLWNPRQLCGAPFLADPSVGLFQPINAVFLFLPIDRAMAAQSFLSLFLMGLFFVLFARSLALGYVPALIGGVVYAFGGASAAAMSHPELAAVLAWTPLLFWALREYPSAWRSGVAVIGGLAAAMMLLGGSPAAAAAVFALAMPYGALCAVQGIRENGKGSVFRAIGGHALLIAIALGVAAVQWLPSAFWLAGLSEPHAALWRLEAAGQIPARVRDILPHMLSAQPDVMPRMVYCSVAALAALPAAFFHRNARLEAVLFSLMAAALFYAATMGAVDTGAFPREAFAFPAAFCMAALAAIGYDRVLATGRDPRSPLIWGPALVMLLTAAAVFFLASAAARGRILPLVLVLLPFLIFRFRWVGGCCGAAIALLIFVDLYGTGVNDRPHPYAVTPGFVASHQHLMNMAEEAALGGRAVVIAHPAQKKTPLNLGMLSSLRMADGFLFPLNRDQSRWWSALSGSGRSRVTEAPGDVLQQVIQPGLLNHMAVRVLLAAVDSGFVPNAWEEAGLRLRAVRLDNGMQCLVNDAAQPRAYWTPGWRAVNGMEETAAVLAVVDTTPAPFCAVEAAGDAYARLTAMLPPLARDAAPPPVDWDSVLCRIVKDEPEMVSLFVEAPQPGVLVLSDAFDSGWRARVNGAHAPILKVNGLFRGVALPAGAHEVVFRYRAIPFWAGLAISGVTLALLAVMGMIRLARRT